MRASQIITLFDNTVNAKDPSAMNKIQVQAARSQMAIHDLHMRAIGCHCECMGMMSENMLVASGGGNAVYGNQAFNEVMVKWGIVDKDNKPTI